MRHCTCKNSLTSLPCIVCGKPKLMTPEWVAKMAEREGDLDATTGLPRAMTRHGLDIDERK